MSTSHNPHPTAAQDRRRPAATATKTATAVDPVPPSADASKRLAPRVDVGPPPTTDVVASKLQLPKTVDAYAAQFPFHLSEYPDRSFLGEGGQGSVYKMSNGDHTVAVKRVAKRDPNTALLRELFCLFNIKKHDHLLRGVGVDQDATHVYIATECWDTARSLADVIHAGQQLPTERDLFRQIGSAVSALHEVQFTHNDIKPANILVTGGGSGTAAPLHVILIDFGHATPHMESPLDVLPTPAVVSAASGAAVSQGEVQSPLAGSASSNRRLQPFVPHGGTYEYYSCERATAVRNKYTWSAVRFAEEDRYAVRRCMQCVQQRLLPRYDPAVPREQVLERMMTEPQAPSFYDMLIAPVGETPID